MLTYGDGLSNVNLKKLLQKHIKSKNCNCNSGKTTCEVWRSNYKIK